jgi:hypothetical protein
MNHECTVCPVCRAGPTVKQLGLPPPGLDNHVLVVQGVGLPFQGIQ